MPAVLLEPALAENPSGISSQNLQQIFSDGLVSFSPLATLIGGDSALSMTQHVANWKQMVVANMAPIGALGMASALLKGADLPDLKNMLGIGDTDLLDACSDFGCGSFAGVTPRMSKRGGIQTIRKESSDALIAHAIIHAKWTIGASITEDNSALAAYVKASRTFLGSTISARVRWHVPNAIAQRDLVKHLNSVFSSGGWTQLFDHSGLLRTIDIDHKLRGGMGVVSLQWPAPAMPMETRPWIAYTSAVIFISTTVAMVLATTYILGWQSSSAAALLLGGQFSLGIGQVIAQLIVQRQRTTLYQHIPTPGLDMTWMLFNNSWDSVFFHRPVTTTRFLVNHITIGQHVTMKQTYIPTWQVVLTSSAIILGFVAFYVGAKSAHVGTVTIYIMLFLAANIFKGRIISYANMPLIAPKCTKHYRVWWKYTSKGHAPCPPSYPPPRFPKSRVSLAPAPSMGEVGQLTQSPSPPSTLSDRQVPLISYRVFAKFAQRHPQSKGMYPASRPLRWAVVAHAVWETCHGRVQWTHDNSDELYMHLPMEFQRPPATRELSPEIVKSVLVIVSDSHRHEDAFWNAVMEVLAISNYAFSNHNPDIFGHPEAALPLHFMDCTLRLILAQALEPNIQQSIQMLKDSFPGAMSMMRAIDLVRGKYPMQDLDPAMYQSFKSQASKMSLELLRIDAVSLAER